MKLNYPKHHLVNIGHISRCQICNSNKLHTILDLGHQPLCDSLLTKETLNDPETTYPLRMVWCQNCTCVQLDYCVDGRLVYHPDYPYRSGITKELAEYQTALSESLVKKYNLTRKDLVIDIGSNDGTLLSGFKKQGVKILGVEPTNIAKIANASGIRTIQKYFDMKVAKQIKKKYGSASLITTTNTFAHMQSLGEFIVGAHLLLKEGGTFVNETHYLLDIIAGGQFDSIYHEHLRTYSLKAYISLFDQYDFTVTDAERGSRYGGNIRVHATKGRGMPVSKNVKQLLKLEKDAGLGRLVTYSKFAQRVKMARFEFMNFIYKVRKVNKNIVGNSCPARASTLLNYYGVDSELLPYLAEQPTSLKLNMFLAGEHIPIVNNQRLIDEQPDYVIILAWHLAKPIIEQLKARGLKSDFVIPLPDFKLIKNSQV